jgi:pyruvate/2-oxoglutarate/acetoin dehydrogenase E1 component
MPAKTLTLKTAILEALFEEMRRDAGVIVIGEDVGAAGGVFKQTEGLHAEFGGDRVIDTPISEAAIFGLSIGAAMTGLRPVMEVMFADFMTLVMDQLVNQAAKVHYMSAGGFRVPLVLRTAVGIGGNLGPQHSQSYHAWVSHVPGLKVAMPSTPADAKGLMKAAIRDDNPVVFFEDRMTYNIKGDVPEGDGLVPLGKADVKRKGRDVTLVAVSRMVQVALKAADILAAEGIEAEVVDPRTLVPLDTDTLVESVKRTNRAIVIDGGHGLYGITGEIASTIGDQAFDWLDAPVKRIGAPQTPIPYNRSLEPLMVPTPESVAAEVRLLTLPR